MIRPDIRRLEWLASAAVLAGIVLLASGIDISTEKVRDSSLGGRITALVTCVLPAPSGGSPAPSGDSPAASASVSETIFPDCETSAPDLLRTAWMTAC